ncbi:hypothetical protein CD30_16870 [Ureibacillus massiliensis 4400831 = CIP 108448 = CCUG 49529]|uniref:Uncharacterized protein n=1 Tax=Ureibacillus massiliensis 4400831 = CIP 108448 = CCUG 49529 TaxID=1211035 RepID=A0A0A3JR25_9BACL|nr:hypothetical protein CD30_16870 [Ureibacillus massiliensis 4400831 = CIP 108448 = CCUG 49529]
MKHYFTLLYLFLFVLFYSNTVFVKAQDVDMPITVEPIYPENHNSSTIGYFNLNVNPGDQQTIEIKITNNKNEEINVSLASAYAYTNATGGIMYKDVIDSLDTELIENGIHIKENITVQDTVTLPPQGSETVPIEITVPEADGETLLGGVLIAAQGDTMQQKQEVEEGTANFTINTEMVIAMAVQLNLPNTVDTDFQIGDAGIYGENAQVYIEMENHAQKIQEDISGTYSVHNDKGEELFNGGFEPFKMAPMSKIRFPIQWGYEMLEDGNYTIRINGHVQGNDFTEVRELQIRKEDVDDFVEQQQTEVTVAKEDNGIPTWIWIAGVVLIGIIMFLLGRRRR